MAEIPKAPLIPIATLGASTVLLLISGIMMTISANKIKDSPRWGTDKEVQGIYPYAATAAGLGLATFIIIALVSLLYLVTGGAKTAKNTRAGRAESKSVLTFSPFLLGGIVVALIITGIVGVLAIMTSSRLSDAKGDDEVLSSAYTYAVISAIVAVGGIGTLIMALFGVAALRTYRKKALAKGAAAPEVVEVTTAYNSVSSAGYTPTTYSSPPPSTGDSFPVTATTTKVDIPAPPTMVAPAPPTMVAPPTTVAPATTTMVAPAPPTTAAPPAAANYASLAVPATVTAAPPAAANYASLAVPATVTAAPPAAANYASLAVDPPAPVTYSATEAPAAYASPVDVTVTGTGLPTSDPVSFTQKVSNKIPSQIKETASYVANDVMTKGSDLAKQVYDQGATYASNYAGSYLTAATTPI